MTVDEIRAVVRLKTMVDSGEITDAQLLLWINEGIWDVSMREDWPHLEANSTIATVASTASYAITGMVSGDEAQTLRYIIRSGNGEPLHPISWELAVARWGDDVQSGTPAYYAVSQEKIWLYPIPDSVETLKIYYVKPPVELSAATDTPAWMSTFHNVLVPFVESKVWEQQEEWTKAERAMNSYFDRIDLMRRAYQGRINYGPWTLGAGRSTRTGRNEPFRSDWSDADV